MEVGFFVVFVAIGFVAEFFDVSFGMGYGTIMIPSLIMLGMEPVQAIPIVLTTSALLGLLGTLSHIEHHNLEFKDKGTVQSLIVFSITGFVGAIIGAFVLSEFRTYFDQIIPWVVAFMVLGGGFMVLHLAQREEETIFHTVYSSVRVIFYRKDSELRKYIALGFFTSIVKVLTGLYGPLLVGGQLLLRINTHRAIATTIFTETVAALTGGFMTLYLIKVDLSFFTPLFIGGVFAIPVGMFFLKRVDGKRMQFNISVFMIFLGAFMLGRLVF
jgi:uncharacterized protein